MNASNLKGEKAEGSEQTAKELSELFTTVSASSNCRIGDIIASGEFLAYLVSFITLIILLTICLTYLYLNTFKKFSCFRKKKYHVQQSTVFKDYNEPRCLNDPGNIISSRFVHIPIFENDNASENVIKKERYASIFRRSAYRSDDIEPGCVMTSFKPK